jgi:hypothetical protein
LLERIQGEALWRFCPGVADELIEREAFEGLERFGEVLGCDEVVEVAAEMVVGLVVETPDGGFFDGAVHALDLAVGPWMLWFGQAMIDAGEGAGVFEGMSHSFSERFKTRKRTFVAASSLGK